MFTRPDNTYNDIREKSLMQWLDDIYRVFVRIDGDVIFYASAACMADLIKHGCSICRRKSDGWRKKTG